MPKDLNAKLAAVEASLKRWQTRLKKATNKVTDLDKQRRRLQLAILSEGQPVIATVKVRKPLTPIEKKIGLGRLKPETVASLERIEATANLVEAVDKQLENASHGMPVDLSIPAMFDRSNPLIAEQMTAARKKAEADARKQMPLSGKEAMAKIRRKK